MEFRKMTACRAAEAVNNGETTACQLIGEILERCNALNGKLNTFIKIAGPEALEQAAAVDKQVKSGQKLPLAGVPVAVKDDLCCRNLPTSFGSPAFKNFISPYGAAAVEKLTDAGAVVIGKTNLDDMSIGSTTTSSPAGPALNPWAPDRVAGSAGAAAVAAGQCLISLESDSGGALRQGASHCGVIGLRPTMGRVSRHGLHTFASSFGQIGITASATDDILAALEVISGFDARDASTALYREMPAKKNTAVEPETIKIGYPTAVIALLDPDHRNLMERAREDIEARGFQLTDFKLDLLAEALRSYYIIAFAETSSNLSRFDGIRFGMADYAENLDELYNKSRRLTFGQEARRRSIFGTFILSQGNYDRYYRQALKIWTLVRREFTAVLDQCDLLLMPAVRTLPQFVTEQIDFCRLYEDDLFCAPVSLAGLPSLCLPVGEVDQLPVGLQLVGRPFSEEMLIGAASRIIPEIKFPPNVIC